MKIYKRYENSTFANFIGEPELVNLLRKPFDLQNNVIIMGGVGTGKTHLAYAILNQEAEKINGNYKSNKVIYVSVKEIIDNIRNCWKPDSDNYDKMIITDYKTYPLLIIDEIGVQYGTPSERIELFEIFNERYNNMLPTIALSNFNKAQIEQTLGLRISDRLFGGAKIFNLQGKSRR